MIFTLKGTDEFGDDLYAGLADDRSIIVWGPSRKCTYLSRVTGTDPQTYTHPAGTLVVKSDDPVYLGATMLEFVGMDAKLVQGEPLPPTKEVEILLSPSVVGTEQ